MSSTVICLEGTHGSGKSSLCEELRKLGYPVLEEGFLDMPKGYKSIHPQSVLMEMQWINNWFQKVLEIASSHKSDTIIFADRSPFSAIYYSNHGHVFHDMIRCQIDELYSLANIDIRTVHIQVDQNILWQRIQQRLLLQPERVLLQENDKSWMEKTLSFYNSFTWDYIVPNNNQSLQATIDTILSTTVNSSKDTSLLSSDTDKDSSFYLEENSLNESPDSFFYSTSPIKSYY